MAIEPKKVVRNEIIDMDKGCNDEVVLEGKVESDKKRKGTMAISLGPCSAAQSDSTDKVHSTKVESNKGKDVVGIMSSILGSFSHQNSADPEDGVGSGSGPYTTDAYAFEDDYLALQSYFDNLDLPPGIEAPIPLSLDTLSASASLARKKKKSAVESGSSYSSLEAESNPKNVTSVETPHKIQHQTMPSHDQLSSIMVLGTASNDSNTHTSIGTSLSFSHLPMDTDNSKWIKSITMNHLELYDDYSGGDMLMYEDAGSSSSMSTPDDEDVQKKYQSFKKFDTVVDHSDHYYSTEGGSVMKRPPKNWAKKIQEEWRILENDLPDTIFVRVYESRMALLRAVIIGAEGTPYHDGLFFFDVCFPSNYPDVPPLVHYRSGGLRINPNLYNCGKVCLSLLNTWTGRQNEMWVPGNSTMLQVLVSIQGLILNEKPYFNEPGFAESNGSVLGEELSLAYNEATLVKSLKTMVYTMRQPPKNFEDLVVGHFRNRVRDILLACRAYMEGVQVGCFVRGGVQDVNQGNKSCSPKFKNGVASCIKLLVGSFMEIRAKEAEEFLHLSENTSPLPASAARRQPFSSLPGHGSYWTSMSNIS